MAVSRQAEWSEQQWRDSPLGDPCGWPSALRLAASLVRDSPAPMWLAWDDALALLANDACRALLPAAHAYRPGAPAADAWADAWDALRPAAMQAIEGRGSLIEELELRVERGQGAASAWAEFSFAPLRDDDGRVRGLLCTMQDLGPLVAARCSLRDSEAAAALRNAQTLETAERYRLAVLSTNDAVWDWNLADGHVIWNRAVQTLFGHTPDATSADWWLDHIHPDDRPRIDSTIHAVIDSQGSSWSGEYRFRRADGSYADIFDRGTVLRDADGRALRMIGAMLDLSEQKATRAALRESERLFRTLFESIDEGFCVIEFVDGPHGPLSDYVHVLANPAYAANTGIEDVVGQRARDMVPLEAQAWIDTYREVLEGGRPLRFERELRHTGRFLELAALRIEPPERRQVAVLFQDITKRHRAELALRDMNDTLERRVQEEVQRHARMEEALRQSQKMEAVGQLTGGIAHDFNNMLAVVSNAMELLGRRLAGSDERALHYVGIAKGGVRRAAQLTQRLLAFSRQQPLQPESVCANDLVAGMSELIRHSLGGAIRVELELGGDPWLLHVDHNQLEHAILNLAVNARDAMERGGQLLIQTANRVLDRHAFVELGDAAPSEYVMIAVADTGTGMAREVLAKAFEPFFTTKEVGRGTGLGLSQVYGFVKQSGGQVRIDSVPGQGTRVELYLPRHLAPASMAVPSVPSVAAPDIVRARGFEAVLVVDDEAAVRDLSAEMLQMLGYTVHVADGAAAALRLLAAHPDIALLFTDVLMPELDGRELAVRALEQRPGLPVLFTSGHTRNVEVLEGMLARARILAKPFTLAQLASQVRMALDGE
ncbi:hybrid sensor histidine kinase/response regulator [Massilia sp. HP4]|uniref:hybrid sensor histidine kinase/response regulator n=1 Tax=Massilia sp. HP4 TaxID=2562316 RepID=UPI001E389BD5|nr:hybrid sensor histidine kinase/response regulator [Massilia sp. HP4]